MAKMGQQTLPSSLNTKTNNIINNDETDNLNNKVIIMRYKNSILKI